MLLKTPSLSARRAGVRPRFSAINRESPQLQALAVWAPFVGLAVEPLAIGGSTGQTLQANAVQSGHPILGHVVKSTSTTNGYTLGTNNVPNLGAELTLSAWIDNWAHPSWCWVVGKGPYGTADSNYYDWGFLGNSSLAETFAIRNGSPTGLGNQSAYLSGLRHWVLTMSQLNGPRNSCLLYCNGKQVGSNVGCSTSATTLNSSDRQVQSQVLMTGSMADVRVYNRWLSAEEVWELYDPKTRWDLYWQPSNRAYGFLSQTPTAGLVGVEDGKSLVTIRTSKTKATGTRPPFLGINRDSPQANGLVRWYALQDQRLRFDAVKPSQLLTLTGAQLDVADPLGRLAFRTDNSNDTGAIRYATAPTGSDFTNATAWSVAVWACPSVFPSGNGCGVFGTGDQALSNSPQMLINMTDQGAGGLRVYWSGNYRTSHTQTAANIPFHVCVTFDGTTLKSYYNGSDMKSYVGAATYQNDYAYIGSGYATQFRGTIADVRAYNRPLTDTEVRALYDPATRWDLYWTPPKRTYVDLKPSTTSTLVVTKRPEQALTVTKSGGATTYSTAPNASSKSINVYHADGSRPRLGDWVVVFGYSGTASTSGCTDNGGNTYLKYDGVGRVDIYYGEVRYLPTTATFTATVTVGTPTDMGITAIVLRNVDPQRPLASASSFTTYASTQYFADANGLVIPPRSLVVGSAWPHSNPSTLYINDSRFLTWFDGDVQTLTVYRQAPSGLSTQRVSYSVTIGTCSAAIACFNARPAVYERRYAALGQPSTNKVGLVRVKRMTQAAALAPKCLWHAAQPLNEPTRDIVLTRSTGDNLGSYASLPAYYSGTSDGLVSPKAWINREAHTILVIASPSSSDPRLMAFSQRSQGGGFPQFALNLNMTPDLNTSAGTWSWYGYWGATYGPYATDAIPATRKPQVFVATRAGSASLSDIKLYRNGIAETMSTQGTASTCVASYQTVELGGAAETSGYSNTVTPIHLVATWDRVLQPNEIALLGNPYLAWQTLTGLPDQKLYLDLGRTPDTLASAPSIWTSKNRPLDRRPLAGTYGINRDSIQAQGLVAWYPLDAPVPVNLVTRLPATISGTGWSGYGAQPTPDARIGWRFPGPASSTNYLVTPGFPFAEFLMTARGYWSVLDDNNRVIGSHNRQVELYVDAGTGYYGFLNGTAYWGGTTYANTRYLFSFRRDTDLNVYAGLNGVEGSGAYNGGTVMPDWYRIGSLDAAGRGTWTGGLWDVRFYRTGMKGLVGEIMRRPFDLYWQPGRRFYHDLGAVSSEWWLTSRVWRPTWHGVLGGMDPHY